MQFRCGDPVWFAKPDRSYELGTIIDRQKGPDGWAYKLEGRTGNSILSGAWVSESGLNAAERPAQDDTKLIEDTIECTTAHSDLEQASPTHFLSKRSDLDNGKDITAHTNTLNRDPGYNSMSRDISKNNKHNNSLSLNTITSNAPKVNLPPDEKENLIEAFVGDLSQDISKDINLFRDPNEAYNRISTYLPALLKNFSIRLESSTISDMARRAKDFIRQQRK